MTESKNNKRPVLAAGSITIFSFAFSQFVRLGANLVLTRLLVPEMFGVMAIVSILITGLSMISDTGIRQYVFWSKDGVKPNVLNTAWMMQIGRGFIIFIFMLLVSFGFYYANLMGWLGNSSTYSHPSLPYVLAAMAIGPLITGFESTKRFELNRRLVMGRLAIMDLSCQMVGLILMILLAVWYKNIWALVAGNILTIGTRAIATHIFLVGHKNSFVWDHDAFQKIFSFSKWILASSILGYLVVNADWLWLGALISAEKLGVYSIGKNLAFVAYKLVQRLSVSVLLPELNNITREDRHSLSVSYYKMRMFIDIPVFVLAGTLFMSSQVIVDFLYDERYRDAGLVLQLLSLLLLGTGYMLANECLIALGQVKRRAIITGVTAVALNIAIPTSYYFFGYTGALYSIVICPLVPIFLLFYYMWENELLNPIRELIFLPMFVVGLGIGWIFNEILGSALF
jgi:O-antigen/teichoic acid export membrane protein